MTGYKALLSSFSSSFPDRILGIEATSKGGRGGGGAEEVTKEQIRICYSKQEVGWGHFY